MRLLIAEDDQALGGFLRRGLEMEGHEVRLASDGQEALDAFYAEMPDLAILDLNLPRCDGIEVLRRMRAVDADCPVLILTGRTEAGTQVACFDLGADDCMFKPFSLQELRARCRVLLRRRLASHTPVLRVGDLALHRIDRAVERMGRRVQLTNREYALLEQLVLERGRPVSRATLLERVWGVASTETNVVDVYINYLRRKLHDRGPDRLIETVRGEGYRIAIPAVVPVVHLSMTPFPVSDFGQTADPADDLSSIFSSAPDATFPDLGTLDAEASGLATLHLEISGLPADAMWNGGNSLGLLHGMDFAEAAAALGGVAPRHTAHGALLVEPSRQVEKPAESRRPAVHRSPAPDRGTLQDAPRTHSKQPGQV